MEKFQYTPKGVCARTMELTIENNILTDLEVIGGCSGNLMGIKVLVIGMKIDDIIKKLSNINCGPRQTSCPDQLAIALTKYKEKQ